MPGGGVTIEVLAERIKEVRADVSELAVEMNRSRTRLHNLEGFAQAYLDIQRENRRQEKRENERITRNIALCGLGISVALLVLAVVTIFVHAH